MMGQNCILRAPERCGRYFAAAVSFYPEGGVIVYGGGCHCSPDGVSILRPFINQLILYFGIPYRHTSQSVTQPTENTVDKLSVWCKISVYKARGLREKLGECDRRFWEVGEKE